MMDYEYKSAFGPYIEALITQKRAIGYDYEAQPIHLRKFDAFCAENFLGATTITKEMMTLWTAKSPLEKEGTVRQRTTPIRHLAEYMNRQGISAFVYRTSMLPKEKRYIPYIYSDDELRRFFEQTDRCHYSVEVPYRHLVMPVLFRVIYCCGLRPGEPRKLKAKDVDLERGVLRIMDSKHDSDRLVPMSPEITEMCVSYARKALREAGPEDYFFSNTGTTQISENNLSCNFRQFLWQAGISHGGKGKGPRIYDFRHTFAVNCLKQMVLAGKDMNAYYPVLKTYMGHSFFKYTEYYLRLTKEMFPDIAKKIDAAYGGFIPTDIGGGDDND